MPLYVLLDIINGSMADLKLIKAALFCVSYFKSSVGMVMDLSNILGQ